VREGASVVSHNHQLFGKWEREENISNLCTQISIDVHRNPWSYVLPSEKTVQALSTVIEALVVCQNLDKKK
jgi:hypothetical protein